MQTTRMVSSSLPDLRMKASALCWESLASKNVNHGAMSPAFWNEKVLGLVESVKTAIDPFAVPPRRAWSNSRLDGEMPIEFAAAGVAATSRRLPAAIAMASPERADRWRVDRWSGRCGRMLRMSFSLP